MPAMKNETEETLLQQVAEKYSVAITDEMHSVSTSPAIARQFLPDVQELNDEENERFDPIGDHTHSPIKGIVHRHSDRCLFMPVLACPVYCRFCFRKTRVGQGQETLSKADMQSAYHYIKQHPEIWEVIITGGDPLILKPKMFAAIISQLNAIPHVSVIRIHSRVPVVDPIRINDELIAALKSSDKTIYIALHANHADEFTANAKAAIAKLADAGIPLLGQSVLLKGINDNIEALSQLMKMFIVNRVKPYYLHHLDLAPGTKHFRTSIASGLALTHQLRSQLSGLCQPHYVLDIPGGFGKIPLQQAYVEVPSGDQNEYRLRDFKGQIHGYKEQI